MTIGTEPVSVLFENDDFLAVDKPAPLLVHPTRPNGETTLLGLLQEQKPNPFYALVNRLDRETSGVVLIAKSPESASMLGKQMMRREVEKYYDVIVRGRVDWDHLKIEKPIGRIGLSESNLIYAKQGIMDQGDPAITECWVVQRLRETTLLKIRLGTGKLHQIRVHLESVGYPVLGDKLYGVDPRIYLEMCEGKGFEEHMPLLRMKRHALHAAELSLDWKNERIKITAPMASEMRRFVEENR